MEILTDITMPEPYRSISCLEEAKGNDIVYIQSKNGKTADWKYFVDSTDPENWIAHTIVQKHGGPLFNFESDQYEVLGQEYADGGSPVGIFRGDKEFISSVLEGKTLTNFKNLYLGNVRDDYDQKIPVLFLDRDGIINYDHGYSIDQESTQLITGIVELIKYANSKNMKVVVLTNQSGVARHHYSEEQLLTYHKFLGDKLEDQGAKVDLWFYCPYHFEKGMGDYAQKSFMRKPWPGMALKACEYFPVDWNKSFMVGDKKTDALPIKGLQNLHLKGKYDLEGAFDPIFEDLTKLRSYIAASQ